MFIMLLLHIKLADYHFISQLYRIYPFNSDYYLTETGSSFNDLCFSKIFVKHTSSYQQYKYILKVLNVNIDLKTINLNKSNSRLIITFTNPV